MLGNRQLVSVFLIVVVLLGVFFSMGYLVGRNTSASAPLDNGSSRATKPVVVDSPTRADAGAPPDGGETTPSAAAASPPAREQEKENPESAKPESAKPESAKPERTSRAEAPRMPIAKHEPDAGEPAGKPSFEEPRPGQTFLQVVATTRADAEFVAETLAKKGLHTTVAIGPTPALYRVLVGPTKDAADLTETRVRVEAAGFKNPYVRKY